MTNTERPIRGYRLIIETSVNNFNDVVNECIREGYQFLNNYGVHMEEIGNTMIYKAEMVLYVPELQTVEAGRPATRTLPEDVARVMADRSINRTMERMERAREESQIPIEEHNRRTEARIRDVVRAVQEREPFDDVEFDGVLDDVQEEIPFDEPRTPPGRNFWTADSPDPFDDDVEEDDDAYNEHQLRRMGMAEEPQTNDEIMDTPQMAEEPQTEDEMPF